MSKDRQLRKGRGVPADRLGDWTSGTGFSGRLLATSTPRKNDERSIRSNGSGGSSKSVAARRKLETEMEALEAEAKIEKSLIAKRRELELAKLDEIDSDNSQKLSNDDDDDEN